MKIIRINYDYEMKIIRINSLLYHWPSRFHASSSFPVSFPPSDKHRVVLADFFKAAQQYLAKSTTAAKSIWPHGDNATTTPQVLPITATDKHW
jgi:hypothetical protein